MLRETIKDVIVKVVEQQQGCKGVKLVTEVIAEYPASCNSDFPALIKECVKEERIVEVKYILHTMQNRIKTFYLPAGTEVILEKP